MKIKRRDFLKTVAGGAALAAVPSVATASAEVSRLPGAVGILYDSTLCVGCQVCTVACKQANNMPVVFSGNQHQWDNPVDLSSRTLSIIKEYENGTRAHKDREVDGYAFVKRQCMHCVDPPCATACPASALTKDPKTGLVSYNKDACIGCRYCEVACPFEIPKFQWDKAFPQIVKCQLCSHLLAKGQIPACCHACPTGASLFGPVNQLQKEARRRQKMQPGKYYDFPLASVTGGKTTTHKAGKYIPHIYGEHENGGTQVLYLAGVPFEKLGLPDLPDRPYTALARSLQHTLYKGMIAPIVAFAALLFVVAKRGKKDE